MADSPQHIYAKYLPNSRGFPLWFPEPSITLPHFHQQNGLQIGDVGVVSPTGRFDVLFNISLPSQHALHQRHLPLLATFKFDPVAIDIDTELDVRSNADPAGSVIMSPGITRIPDQFSPKADNYEFVSTSATGAILILPDGATCHDLLSKERFRTVAMDHAFDWYEIARKRYGETIDACSLYLITGFYKARSWCVASYHDPTSIGLSIDRRIKATTQNGVEGGTTRRYWENTFPVHCRDGPGRNHNGNVNQTVYISGFKIAVREDAFRWLTREPVIEPVPAIPTGRHLCYLARFLKKLFGRQHSLRYRYGVDGGKTIDYVPALSPPFHPSDAINRFLLKQDPNALVAVTHDSQWMVMVETGEVMPQDFAQEEWFERFLSEHHSLAFQSENNAVYLQHKGYIHHEPKCNTWQRWYPTPSTHEPKVIITRIRAENIAAGLGRMPIGFCVLFEFDDTQKKTQNKPVRVGDSVIEWDDVIVLPSQTSSKIQLSVCASFELSPMLGKGEVLHALEKSAEEWERDDPLILFSPRHGGNLSHSSLVISVERRALKPLEISLFTSNIDLDSQVPSELALQTDLGHHALLCYRSDPTQENIDVAIQHFERAREICPRDHPCCFAVMRNLAMAYLLDYQINNTYTSLDKTISLHREALNWCPFGHPDRPATLVYLAQALVYRYDELIETEVNALVAEAQGACSVESYEYRATKLVLQTCARIISSAPLDKLILELELAAQAPFDSFDRPQRLHNLGTVLHRRYKLRGDFGDLDKSIAISEEAIGLMPIGHPDRTRIIASLCDSLTKRYERTRNVADLEYCIFTSEAALQWAPQTNVDRTSLLTSLCDSLTKRFELTGDVADLEKSISTNKATLKWMPKTNVVGLLMAIQAWVQSAEVHAYSSILKACQMSLSALDHFTFFDSSLDSRHETMQSVANLANDAFSRAARHGDLHLAVELLEKGRGILWNQLARFDICIAALESRGDKEHELASQFTRLSADLRKHTAGNADEGMDPYWRILEEWQSAVDKIRHLDGFSQFLLPPCFADLQRVAECGPVIIVNASEYTCDAIIVLCNRTPVHIPLPCSLVDVLQLCSQLSELTQDPHAYGDIRGSWVRQMLRDLWSLVVEPIVSVLQNDIELPTGSRIWWCPTSKFTILPFHAAGPYRKTQKNLMDVYVSSYTPSLSALIRTRDRVRSQKAARDSSGTASMISFAVIGQARPSASVKLPEVEREIGKIRSETGIPSAMEFETVTDDAATIEGTIRAFRDHCWVHVACRSAQHAERPFKSWFAMGDGELTLMRIIQERYTNSDFAFLSTGSTAVGDSSTPDEVLHLAAGMQFAGFSGVIGSLWRVDDAVAHKVVTRFYREMFGRPLIDFEHAAEALNVAVVKSAQEVSLEDRIVFVHIGI